jgi:hypothetical protein
MGKAMPLGDIWGARVIMSIYDLNHFQRVKSQEKHLKSELPIITAFQNC